MSDIKRLKELYKLLRTVDKKMLAIRNKATDDKMLADAMEVCAFANLSATRFVGDLIEERES